MRIDNYLVGYFNITARSCRSSSSVYLSSSSIGTAAIAAYTAGICVCACRTTSAGSACDVRIRAYNTTSTITTGCTAC
jgi:hypothetical protein